MQTTAQILDGLTHAEAKILAHYAAGETTREIASTSGNTVADVEVVINTIARGNRNLARTIATEWQSRAKTHVAPPAAPPQVKSARPAPDAIADLLTEAVETGDPKLVKAADKISDLVEDLEAQMVAYRTQKALRDEAAQLEARLAAIRAQIQPGAKASPSLTDSKAVRAWARNNKTDCPAFGRIPARVLDAYQLATQPALTGK
jgi:hypothetical protein